jgi:hypothetical protein
LTSLGLSVLEAENAQQALEHLDGGKTVDLSRQCERWLHP